MILINYQFIKFHGISISDNFRFSRLTTFLDEPFRMERLLVNFNLVV